MFDRTKGIEKCERLLPCILVVQDEVDKLESSTLSDRERDIIRLYYGLDDECLTWEDISKRYVHALYMGGFNRSVITNISINFAISPYNI